MSQRHGTKLAAGLACAALVVAFAGPTASAQKPADVAAKFTGTWKLNKELSPGLSPMRASGPARAGGAADTGAPAGGGGGRRGGGPAAGNVAFAVAAKPVLGQGGGGQMGGDPSMAAIRDFEGMPDSFTITASADSVTFNDAIRGDRVFPTTDKNVKMTIKGATVTATSKWDKNSLKQDFSAGEENLSGTWDLNDAGNRLSVHFKLLNMSSPTGGFTEVKAVYDKQ